MDETMVAKRKNFDQEVLLQWDEVHIIAQMVKNDEARVVKRNGRLCTVLNKKKFN